MMLPLLRDLTFQEEVVRLVSNDEIIYLTFLRSVFSYETLFEQ
jgi:hypothetical protein